VGIDIGGTCTDCVVVDEEGKVTLGKAFSTPPDFSRGILDAIAVAADALGIGRGELLRSTQLFLHSTTVAENAVVDGTLAKAGVITTSGFGDTLFAMRGGYGRWSGLTEDEKRNPIETDKLEPIVPGDLVRTVRERVDVKGDVLREVDEVELEGAVRTLLDAGVEALGVSFVWAFTNPANEQKAKAIVRRLAPDAFLTVSHEIAPIVGEYERTSTVALNARLGTKAAGIIVTSSNHERALSTAALDRLSTVPADGHIHEVPLPGVGTYRVKVASDSTGSVRLVAGMSTHDVDEAIGTLVLWAVLLALAAVAIAAAAGRYLVRRQLRPLRDVAATAHEVADLPLSSGEIGTTMRVPAALTDEWTEVGAVGRCPQHAAGARGARARRAAPQRAAGAPVRRRRLPRAADPTLDDPRLRRADPPDASGRPRPARDGDGQGAGGGDADVPAGRGPAAPGAPRRRPTAGPRRGRRHPAGAGDRRRRARGQPGHRWLLDLPGEPVTATGDEQRLHQVVTNLLGNARRHTPPGTSVRVGVRAKGVTVVVRVEDDGPGMPPELVEHVFERFTRGDSSRTRESGGAGLGLSLVQAITAAHGGDVAVTSEPGRTRFEVRLPGHPAPVPTPDVVHR
jgi:two-component system OmpR family sensor kinase